jgi:histone H3/H4
MIPISNIQRIMKEAMFQDCKLPKDAMEFVQACLSKFITHITMVILCVCVCARACAIVPKLHEVPERILSGSCIQVTNPYVAQSLLCCLFSLALFLRQSALEKCDRESRKSITADDLIWAIKQSSEFNHYTECVRSYTHRYRAIEATTRLTKRNEGL